MYLKNAELGRKYTYSDLEQDSGYTEKTIRTFMSKGESRFVAQAISKALNFALLDLQRTSQYFISIREVMLWQM